MGWVGGWDTNSATTARGFLGRYEPFVGPNGERLSLCVGGGLHGVTFALRDAGANDEGARPDGLGGRSSGLPFLGHAAENIRPRNPLTMTGYRPHNYGMTTTAAKATTIISTDPGWCPGCGHYFRGERGLRAHQAARFVSMGCRPVKQEASK